MFKTKCRGMSPLCSAVVTALSLVGAFSLFMLAKKKMGCAMKEVKKVGGECAKAVEDGIDAICRDCGSGSSSSSGSSGSSSSGAEG